MQFSPILCCTCAAGSSTRLRGSPTTRELVDLNETEDGLDEALAALLDGQVPQPDPKHQHYVLQSGKFCEGLERRSVSTSSTSGSESDGRQSPLTRTTDVADETGAAWGRNICRSVKGLNVLLELSALQTAWRRCRRYEALVDYSKSILLRSEQYIETMELKAKKKEDALVEAAHRQEEVHQRHTT